MKLDLIVAEIGSTTTVVNGFTGLNSPNPTLVGQGQGPTTVEQGDVTQGLEMAISNLAKKAGVKDVKYHDMLATSSAAGGLKMTVHGLVYDMTARAAKEAALGAGAVIKDITNGKLKDRDIARIQKINPNIILLAGGVDFGEEETTLENAYSLSKLPLDVPFIYGGNKKLTEEIVEVFEKEGKTIRPIENVYPAIDQLNIEPARRIIQEIFEQHITKGPGMSNIRQMVNSKIVPTPGAVMMGAKALYEEIGDLMVVDVGGATTDVHSVTEGSEELSRFRVSPEPFAKRTVEGDLGVYVNSQNIVEMIGQGKVSELAGINEDDLEKNILPIPENQNQRKLSSILTEKAACVAVNRHVGKLKTLYGPSGRYKVVEGKDLTQVKWIIGTGGALTRLSGGTQTLKKVKLNVKGDLLLPKEGAKPLLDNDYNLGVLGVMSAKYPKESIQLMKKSLKL
ncbi:GlmL-related ornithine degradation protein [Proteinivorax hydrogeniformans]|uniref:GlmL-related ornithine degradation protein n=1 Tax=Proteinivorax hydrogeniformans TaxID=1826727 RepID=A0AAU8HU56_9FIRM